MQTKHIVLAGVLVVVLFGAGFLVGFFATRGSRTEIDELKSSSAELTTTVTRLETELGLANGTIAVLRKLRDEDRATIDDLSAANRTALEAVGEQRRLLESARAASRAVGDRSSSVEAGLSEVVGSIDELIDDITK